MSSEIIVAAVLAGLAVGLLVWLELRSRRNKQKGESSDGSE
jgi:hypothetical protein